VGDPTGTVATQVGFQNFKKYDISRNKLLISRDLAKFLEIFFYASREISERNLNFAKYRKYFPTPA
jgi:hypothetical protein